MLKLLASLEDLPEQLKVRVIEMLAGYVSRVGPETDESSENSTNRFPNLEIGTCRFATHSVKTLAEVFASEKTSLTARRVTFDRVIQIINEIFVLPELPHDLVDASMQSFRKICEAGLGQAFEEFPPTSQTASDTWQYIGEAVDNFLKKPPLACTRDPSRDLKLDMIDCIVDILLPDCSSAPVEVTSHFLEVLKKGTLRNVGNVVDSQSSQACLAGICRLCVPASPKEHEITIANTAFPVFLMVVSALLTRYLSDETGNVSLPEFRKQEAINALKLICRLKVPPELKLNLDSLKIESQIGYLDVDFPRLLSSGTTGKRQHILILFPIFCELVMIQDHKIRKLVRTCLQLYQEELGISAESEEKESSV